MSQWNDLKKRVVIVGGTHGNERNGIYLIKQFESDPNLNKNKTFQLETFVGNPRALVENRRYLDTDLNRCFLLSDLQNLLHSSHYERNRAFCLNALLGPKGSNSPSRADMIFDLHNTVSNTGILLLFHPNDVFSHQIVQYIQKHHPHVRALEWLGGDVPLLPSVGHSGMTIEVGPVTHGCLHAGLLAETKKVLLTALGFIEKHNSVILHNPNILKLSRPDSSMEIFTKVEKPIKFSRNEQGDLTTFIHPDLEGKDFQELKNGDNILISSSEESIKWENPYEFACYPHFINEAAYYESDIAFVLARKSLVTFPASFVEN